MVKSLLLCLLNQDINVRVGSKSIQGKLIALQPDPDPSTNTHSLRIRLSGEAIQSGMLASADLPLVKRLDALTIPVSSVATNAGESHVYIYKEGEIKRIPVELSQRVGSEYIISSGLQAGGDDCCARRCRPFRWPESGC